MELGISPPVILVKPFIGGGIVIPSGLLISVFRVLAEVVAIMGREIVLSLH